ncbi:MAG: nickel pincer cofactor biosynthesis protein LarB [bacterium]|nr:nickel pincer cofactor biosynthesis protein LarB [bacterium]MDD5353825.1 nickel pincer cofactor biosynthesis protein LarB [bacterium]MDD5756149.1 nickel pincer cofactor biosynthesis protein LarB [bacterium]
MQRKQLEMLLQQVKNRTTSTAKAMAALKDFPCGDLGFAKVDHHRGLRQGFPEVIYCPGKTIPQIIKIIGQMQKHKENILATRADKMIFKAVKKKFRKAVYNELARSITILQSNPAQKKGVLIITAGTADLPVAEEAAVTCELLGQKPDKLYDVGVAGVHRLLNEPDKINQARVIIVVAGMEGALPSVVGGLVDKPVIAVPTSVGYGAAFGGVAALLAMLNSCAPNVTVVNIDDGFGAGVVASLINK